MERLTESELVEEINKNLLGEMQGRELLENIMKNLEKVEENAYLLKEELEAYRAIGTVSEFRELKEKATGKKPTDVRYFGEAGYYIGLCPTCKNGNNSEYEYCGDCGQKLQWFERSEGKE